MEEDGEGSGRGEGPAGVDGWVANPARDCPWPMRAAGAEDLDEENGRGKNRCLAVALEGVEGID